MQTVILKPMTDFVLEQSEKINDPEMLCRLLVKYAMFLKQPLTIEMFVATDKDGNVLDPYHYDRFNSGHLMTAEEMIKYRKYESAKSIVLFKGFEIETLNIKNDITAEILKLDKCRVFWKDINVWNKSGLHNIIEDLVKYNLELTESAITILVL